MSKKNGLPRMVEVRSQPDGYWAKREMVANLSHIPNIKRPFLCRHNVESARREGELTAWEFMREIEEPMTFVQFFNENTGSQVWSGVLQPMYDAYQSYLSEFNQK